MDQPSNDRHRLDIFEADSSDDEPTRRVSFLADEAEDDQDQLLAQEENVPLPYSLKLSSKPTATHLHVAAHAYLTPFLLGIPSTDIGTIVDGKLIVGRILISKNHILVALLPQVRPVHCHGLAQSLIEAFPVQTINIYTALPQTLPEGSTSILSTTQSSQESTLKVPAFLQGVEASLLVLAEEQEQEAVAFVFNQDMSVPPTQSADTTAVLELLKQEIGQEIDLGIGRKAMHKLSLASKRRPSEMYA
jgi:hypothetical protein